MSKETRQARASVFDGASFKNSELPGVNGTKAEWPKPILPGQTTLK